MPTRPTPDDLLALARFCWPDREWTKCPVGARTRRRLDATMDAYWAAADRDHVSAAEAVLIERGLGNAYLGHMIFEYHALEAHGDTGMNYDVWALVAPLDARVRAMVEVVRQEEAKHGK